MKTGELLEQRAALVDRMNAAHEKDDNTAFETAETELRSIEAKLARQRTIDAAERAEHGKPLTGSTDEHLSRELRQFSVSRMIAHKAGLAVDAGREIEMQAELAKRAGKAPRASTCRPRFSRSACKRLPTRARSCRLTSGPTFS